MCSMLDKYPCIIIEFKTKQIHLAVEILVSWLEGCQITRNRVTVKFLQKADMIWCFHGRHWHFEYFLGH